MSMPLASALALSLSMALRWERARQGRGGVRSEPRMLKRRVLIVSIILLADLISQNVFINQFEKVNSPPKSALALALSLALSVSLR